jgi:hypothetical protein
MFPLQFTLLGGSFVFLDVGPSILFFVFPFYLFWVLWLVYMDGKDPSPSLSSMSFVYASQKGKKRLKSTTAS